MDQGRQDSEGVGGGTEKGERRISQQTQNADDWKQAER